MTENRNGSRMFFFLYILLRSLPAPQQFKYGNQPHISNAKLLKKGSVADATENKNQ